LEKRAKASSNGLYNNETHFLESLKENIEKRKSSADELLEKYHGSWNKDLTKIFEEYSY
jgi:glutamate--cysteine ligase